MADLKARQLIKQIPELGVSQIDIPAQTSVMAGGSGWKQINLTTGGILWVWRGYIDLAGYSRDDLTFFTQAVDIQDSMIPIISPGTFWLNVVDLLTTRRITDSELFPNNFKNSFISSLSDGENIDLQEVIYGTWSSSTPYSATNPAAIKLGSDTFGIGNPSAADRMHCTRIITFNGAPEGEAFNVGPVNYVVGGVTSKEKDLIYIERLRRAYTQDAGRNV